MAKFEKYSISDFHESHEQWMEEIKMYEGTEAGLFGEFAMDHGDGMHEVVSSDWTYFTDSPMMFARFLWLLDKALTGKADVCYPVINGVPRLCFALKGAPTSCYLTEDEKLRYSYKHTNYTQCAVTYLPDLHAFEQAVEDYLEGLPQKDVDDDFIFRDYPGKGRLTA